MFNSFKSSKTPLYVSLRPKSKGGGSNSFSYNFKRFITKKNTSYRIVNNLCHAKIGIIIADKAELPDLMQAKRQNCFIIHRLDEYFESNESEYRQIKHNKIKAINSLADITVYQSQFVFDNVNPYLKTAHYKIIYNGADPSIFFPTQNNPEYIGHISWGIGERKRLDLVLEAVKKYRDENFLLIGNHKNSSIKFSEYKNVTLIGPVNRNTLPKYLRKMKALYFPSENDPCPNTVVESILCGTPVCFNPLGGTKELVKDCGVPLNDFDILLNSSLDYSKKCLSREDLHFERIGMEYLSLMPGTVKDRILI